MIKSLITANVTYTVGVDGVTEILMTYMSGLGEEWFSVIYKDSKLVLNPVHVLAIEIE